MRSSKRDYALAFPAAARPGLFLWLTNPTIDRARSEFFKWSLRNAANKHGGATLKAVFEKYDRDGSGYVDATEFTAACQEMGYGGVAHQIFKSIDVNNSGSVSYHELSQTLEKDVPQALETKKLITSLIWGWDQGTKIERQIDTSRWVIQGRDARSVKHELRALLEESGYHVADILRLFDQDAGTEMTIDDVEFNYAMRKHFGYNGNSLVLSAVFKELDTDSSGYIGFDELYEFIRGHRHSLDERNKRVRGMKLTPPPGASFTLNEIRWDVETLRQMLLAMMSNCNLGPADVLKAWDKDGSGFLEKFEFREEVGQFFKGPILQAVWADEVEEVVDRAFDDANKDVGSGREWVLSEQAGAAGMDVIEMQRWFDQPMPEGFRIILKTKSAVTRQLAVKNVLEDVGEKRKKEGWRINGRVRRFADVKDKEEAEERARQEAKAREGSERAKEEMLKERQQYVAGLLPALLGGPLLHMKAPPPDLSSRSTARPLTSLRSAMGSAHESHTTSLVRRCPSLEHLHEAYAGPPTPKKFFPQSQGSRTSPLARTAGTMDPGFLYQQPPLPQRYQPASSWSPRAAARLAPILSPRVARQAIFQESETQLMLECLRDELMQPKVARATKGLLDELGGPHPASRLGFRRWPPPRQALHR